MAVGFVPRCGVFLELTVLTMWDAADDLKCGDRKVAGQNVLAREGSRVDADASLANAVLFERLLGHVQHGHAHSLTRLEFVEHFVQVAKMNHAHVVT